MMTKVKYFLFMLFGAFYASCIWMVCLYGQVDPETGVWIYEWVIAPFTFLIIGSILLFLAVVFSLIEHWND